jgi:ABC-type branched-subunit amino acid transport system permease subunit
MTHFWTRCSLQMIGLSLRYLICYVQYWTGGEEYIVADFHYSFLEIDYLWYAYAYQISIIHCISLRYLICYVQYWTGGEEYISDFHYSLHFLRYLICYVQYWTGGEEYISGFHYSLHFLRYLICYVQYWTGGEEYIVADFHYSFLGDRLPLICICSVELVDMKSRAFS